MTDMLLNDKITKRKADIIGDYLERGEKSVKNNIHIANETLRIIKTGSYKIDKKTIDLLSGDYSEVKVYSPDRIYEIMNKKENASVDAVSLSDNCNFYVVNEDSYQAAQGYERPLVMNFANAHQPGGGFRLGATAQEEALCRNSTLYASISSDKASEMYQYNLKHMSPTDSAYMLLSPDVCVFRDVDCQLLESPYMVSVITIPAPNKRGAAMFTSQSKLDTVMKERIRMMLKIATENKYRTLILGAWGCGAFGHDAKKVAGYFKEIFIDEHYSRYFENVVFAILSGKRKDKLEAFSEAFGDI